MRLKLDIKLSEIKDPEVHRQMWIPMDITFDQLHMLIQAAMGWEARHLYAFSESEDSRFFQVVSPYLEEGGIDGTTVPVENILFSYYQSFQMKIVDLPQDKLYYLYDFGDSWLHEIQVMDFDRDSNKTELISGSGACPPEDCGGLPGFTMYKDFLAGRMSKADYFDLMVAVDSRGYDPKKFDLKKAQRRVASLRG